MNVVAFVLALSVGMAYLLAQIPPRDVRERRAQLERERAELDRQRDALLEEGRRFCATSRCLARGARAYAAELRRLEHEVTR